jgi:hypothetical protein
MNGLHRLRRPIALLVTLLLLSVISACLAAAQGALTIPQASLKLWPEYDDPGLLVIFAGDFAEGATFPQTVAFPIAEGARNIQATVNDPAKGLLSQEWQMQDGKVTYSLPQPGFHIEYYVDRPPSGNKRAIVHTFEAPYPIKSLEIAVQQPARATDFSLTPAPSRTTTGSDGLTYHIINLENLAAGEKRDIVISYVKTDTGLTSPQLAVTSATPAAQASAPTQPQTKQAALPSWLPLLLIGVGLLALIGIGVYWFTSRRRAVGPIASAEPAPASAPLQPAARPTSGEGAAFCTQCGHALRPDDRFCAQCGTPRKSQDFPGSD